MTEDNLWNNGLMLGVFG